MERRWESRPSWRFGETNQHTSQLARCASETNDIDGIERVLFTMVVTNHDNMISSMSVI